MTEGPPHAIIVGCGRVGAGLAERLHERSYTVTVIDVDRAAFRRLGHLPVEQIEGIGFDRGTLQRAGIERAATLAAVTNGDNTNIVVARSAREVFGVPRVFARIADIRRAAIYERLGIPTVASVSLSIEMALRWALPDEAVVRWVDPSSRVCIVERTVPGSLVGSRVSDIEAHLEITVVAIGRLGVSMIAAPTLVAQDGDTLYAAIAMERVAQLEEQLSRAEASTGGGHQ